MNHKQTCCMFCLAGSDYEVRKCKDCPCHTTTQKQGEDWEDRLEDKFGAYISERWHAPMQEALKAFIAQERVKAQVKMLDELLVNVQPYAQDTHLITEAILKLRARINNKDK